LRPSGTDVPANGREAALPDRYRVSSESERADTRRRCPHLSAQPWQELPCYCRPIRGYGTPRYSRGLLRHSHSVAPYAARKPLKPSHVGRVIPSAKCLVLKQQVADSARMGGRPAPRPGCHSPAGESGPGGAEHRQQYSRLLFTQGVSRNWPLTSGNEDHLAVCAVP
jgi:hypothetical protein